MIPDLSKYPRLNRWAKLAADAGIQKVKEEAAKRAGKPLVSPPKPILARVVQNPYTWVGLGFLSAGLLIVVRRKV